MSTNQAVDEAFKRPGDGYWLGVHCEIHVFGGKGEFPLRISALKATTDKTAMKEASVLTKKWRKNPAETIEVNRMNPPGVVYDFGHQKVNNREVRTPIPRFVGNVAFKY